MSRNSLIVRFFSLLVFSILIGYFSIFLSYRATQYDLGQLAYVLVVFFPIVSIITGVLSEVFLKKIWMAAILSAFTFIVIFISRFNLGGYPYILAYIGITSVSYLVALGIRKVYTKITKSKDNH